MVAQADVALALSPDVVGKLLHEVSEEVQAH
jgi:hypothetical protein